MSAQALRRIEDRGQRYRIYDAPVTPNPKAFESALKTGHMSYVKSPKHPTFEDCKHNQAERGLFTLPCGSPFTSQKLSTSHGS